MPHRLFVHLDTAVSQFIEGTILLLAGIGTGCNYLIAILSEEDWSKLTGPHGVAFLAVIAVIVLWGNGIRREKQEEKRRVDEEIRRERRHTETLNLQRENSNKLIELTGESIKSNAYVTAAITALTKELESRPCGINFTEKQ